MLGPEGGRSTPTARKSAGKMTTYKPENYSDAIESVSVSTLDPGVSVRLQGVHPAAVASVLAGILQYESNYGAQLVGDGGSSEGPYQFSDGNLVRYRPPNSTGDWRYDPTLSARSARAMLADIIQEGAGTLRMMVPWLAHDTARTAWRRGVRRWDVPIDRMAHEQVAIETHGDRLAMAYLAISAAYLIIGELARRAKPKGAVWSVVRRVVMGVAFAAGIGHLVVIAVGWRYRSSTFSASASSGSPSSGGASSGTASGGSSGASSPATSTTGAPGTIDTDGREIIVEPPWGPTYDPADYPEGTGRGYL